MRIAWAIAINDLKQRLRDRSAYIVGLVAPLGLAVVFGFVLAPAQNFEVDAKIGVVDLDRGPVAELFVEGTLAQQPNVELVRIDSVDAAMALVDTEVTPFSADEDIAHAVIVIPAGFSDDVQSDRPVVMEVIANETSDVEAGMAVAMTQGRSEEVV